MKANIEQQIIEQLKAAGTATEPYLSLVQDYCAMFDISEMLKANITDKGAIYPNGRVNPCVRELRNTNAAMLKLLKAIGLDPEAIAAAADEADEL